MPLTRRLQNGEGPPRRHTNTSRAKVVFRRKTAFALYDHHVFVVFRVWLRVNTEVYTEVKQLGSGGRRGFDV